ncbi:MAG TPA: hypothetical protein VGG48_20365 [Rhizomicrobium sp.]|jgi:Ca2+-binding RTX toxin-like protein
MPVTPIEGTAGNDTLTGTSGNDRFNVYQGGNDSVSGLAGDDVATFGNSFNANDHFDGGDGNDVLRLTGDGYSNATIAASSLTSVEQIQPGAGHDYNLTLGDIAVSGSFTINGISLGAGDALTVDGSAMSTPIEFVGGEGTNAFTGNDAGDIFNLRKGGTDIVHGGAGDDRIYSAGITGSDVFDGGGGDNRLHVVGTSGSTDTAMLGADAFGNLERVVFTGGNFDITTNDANVPGGTILYVNPSLMLSSQSFRFDGSAETDGAFNIHLGQETDTIIGGAGNDYIYAVRNSISGTDTFTGGGGADVIFDNGVAHDTFIFNSASDSTGTQFDEITDVNFAVDTFIGPNGAATFHDHYTGGYAGFDTIVADAEATIDASRLAAFGTEVWTPTSGIAHKDGFSFIFIDVNGIAGYQSGKDIMILTEGAVTGF